MATWQSLNGGGLLAGIGSQNNNAPQARDNLQTLGLIQQNNEFTRQGGNNVGLQALQGLGGLASMHQQEQQQKAIGAFNQAHAQAWKTGDNSILREFAATNPAFVAQAQQAVAGLDEQQRNEMGMLAMGANTALSQGPEAFGQYIQQNAEGLKRVGADPNWMLQSGMQNPDQLSHLATTLAMGALGPEKAFAVKDKMEGREINRGKLAENIRSNQASEANTRYGHNVSRENSIRSGSGGGAAPASVREYQYFNSLSPEQQQTYLRVRGRPGGDAENTVQLSDGRTVTVSGKLHGSGASAFYEGKDDNGNMVRVPASSISAPPTSAATAQNYAMAKDINAILDADEKKLNFMTGITGGVGEASLFAEQSSRVKSQDERALYTASRRIQGKMQNQGVAAARDMGASGINTVAEAKMYFQGMPQVDYSSPETMKQSVRDIQEYTDNYNQQYKVDIGGNGAAQQPPEKPRQQTGGGGYTSKSGIQFTVE